MTFPSPSATESPHLGGIQPTWRDLPYACELVYAIHKLDTDSFEDITTEFVENNGKSKTEQTLNFLGKLGIIGDDGVLLPNGVFLADAYTPAEQETLGREIQPGVKSCLSTSEQAFWKTLLFERDWLPMLATVNIVATREVSTSETESRAKEFKKRLNHLNEYQDYESINTWKKKAQTHFGWLEYIGLAESNERDQYTLTEGGWDLHNHVHEQYHPDWPSAIRD